MEILKLDLIEGKEIKEYQSDFFLANVLQLNGKTNMGFLKVGKEGKVGYHQATASQWLLILEGTGIVRGEKNKAVSVDAGDLIFWKKDEWHETQSEKGMKAIVIESEDSNFPADTD